MEELYQEFTNQIAEIKAAIKQYRKEKKVLFIFPNVAFGPASGYPLEDIDYEMANERIHTKFKTKGEWQNIGKKSFSIELIENIDDGWVIRGQVQ